MYHQKKQLSICILEVDYAYFHEWQYQLQEYLKEMGYLDVVKIKLKKNSFDQLQEIVKKDFDIYFNICDGSSGENQAGSEVARFLTYANVPFIGPDIYCYEPSRQHMKNICIEYGLKTPACGFIYDIQKDIKKVSHLKFPLIVKHYNSAGSSGLTLKSKVLDQSQLRTQLKIMLDQYGGALVQQFIEGRQFTCLVSQAIQEGKDPIAYQPIEYAFTNPIDDFKYEYIKTTGYLLMEVKQVKQKQLNKQIKRISSKFFQGMNMTSYARIDLRMNKKNQFYLLEINPVPSMFYNRQTPASGDQILLRIEGGHHLFIQKLIKGALLRFQRNKVEKVDLKSLKQSCQKEAQKQIKLKQLNLPEKQYTKVLLNLYLQSFSQNHPFKAQLSKDILQILKKQQNRELQYDFDERQENLLKQA